MPSAIDMIQISYSVVRTPYRRNVSNKELASVSVNVNVILDNIHFTPHSTIFRFTFTTFYHPSPSLTAMLREQLPALMVRPA